MYSVFQFYNNMNNDDFNNFDFWQLNHILIDLIRMLKYFKKN